jgi:beta-lactamase regulating signal transducer with metallopeptidase domain
VIARLIATAVALIIYVFARVEINNRMGNDKAGKIWLWVLFFSTMFYSVFLTSVLTEIIPLGGK